MPKVSQITKGILIQVEPLFSELYSNADAQNFVFTYKITIQNNTDFTCKLVSRKWEIFDSINHHSEVEGDGVIGKQPIITPGEVYSYESYCPLRSEVGYMKGIFNMFRLDNNTYFEVVIPQFELIAKQRLN